MNKTIIILLSCMVSIAILSTVQARPKKRLDERTKSCRILDNGTLDWESDHWGIGAQKFKAVCKSCHSKDNASGAPFLYMETYSSTGWNNVFARRSKKCARDGSWDILSEDELLLVNDYLYRNANDTYDPNDADTCG
jgi:hypothetical protein